MGLTERLQKEGLILAVGEEKEYVQDDVVYMNAGY